MSNSLDLGRLSNKDLLCTSALPLADIEQIYATATLLKNGRTEHTAILQHKRLAMIFEKD